MSKELSEMSLEELWELFPVSLVPHNDKWKEYYKEIEATLTALLKGYSVERISHIGSTAIKGICAKNIVDVLVELSESEEMEDVARVLEKNGFIKMSSNDKRISLNKGYTKDGLSKKVYHVHLRYAGDNDELYFRDYLNKNPNIAKEYERLKLKLCKEYEHDRDAYTAGKADFVWNWTDVARDEYGEIYAAKKTSPGKELPTVVTLLLILLGVAAFLLFCIATGVMIDAIVAFAAGCVKPEEATDYMWRIVPAGVLHILFFIAFCLDGIPGLKRKKSDHYREDIAGMFLIVLGFSSIVLMALAGEYDRTIDGVIGTLLLPAIGIAITPKLIKKEKSKIRKWEARNALSSAKREEAPITFERQLFGAVLKHHLKDLLIGLVAALVFIALAVHRITSGPVRGGLHPERATYLAFVTLVAIAIFAIPVLSVLLTRLICRLRLVKRHMYQVRHVIAKRADDKELIVEGGVGPGRYGYPVCIGIRKKDVHDTKATLIIFPDTVMLFPDEKYDKTE